GEEGWAFIVDDPPGVAPRCCPAPAAPGSAYCAEHARLCRLRPGSAAEERKLAALAALADAVGGRQGRRRRRPPDPLLRRLDHIERLFLRAHRSRYVREM